MKKIITVVNAVFLIMLIFAACSQKADNKITSIENPPFTEEITLNVGQEKQGYFIVFSSGDFRLDDIVFKNKNEEVVKLSFLKIERLHYVFYTVEALEEGEDYIWFETKDSSVSTSMIKVSVGKNSVPTPESTTEAENTTDTENNTEITENTSLDSYTESTTQSNTVDYSENTIETTKSNEAATSKETAQKEPSTKEPLPQTSTNSEVVYITPTGKKYHLKESCAGKNAIKTTLEAAEATGKTPCKKCAGG